MNADSRGERVSARLAEVVQELESSGWVVHVDPLDRSLPEPLRDTHPDFVARRGNEFVVGEVASRSSAVKQRIDLLAQRVALLPNARLEVYWLGDTPEITPIQSDVLGLAHEASRIADTVGTTAALLVAWAALEGAITRYSAKEQKLTAWRSPREQLANLYSLGFVDQVDFDRLASLWRLRSEIAHKASRRSPSRADIEFVTSIAERMASDRYVSVDEIVEWAVEHLSGRELSSQAFENRLAERFPQASVTEVRFAARAAKSLYADIRAEAREEKGPRAAVQDSTPSPFASARAKFELYRDEMNQYRFRLKGSNGEIVASSEAYESKDAALRAIDSVRLSLSDAGLVDRT